MLNGDVATSVQLKLLHCILRNHVIMICYGTRTICSVKHFSTPLCPDFLIHLYNGGRRWVGYYSDKTGEYVERAWRFGSIAVVMKKLKELMTCVNFLSVLETGSGLSIKIYLENME